MASNRRRLIQTTSCFASFQSHCCVFQFASSSQISFLFSIDLSTSTKEKTNELYQSPTPGFEPTTFLIHDLERRIDALDRSATVGRHIQGIVCSCDFWSPSSNPFRPIITTSCLVQAIIEFFPSYIVFFKFLLLI